MRVEDLVKDIEEGKIQQVYNGIVYKKDGLFAQEIRFGGLPDTETRNFYTWEDITTDYRDYEIAVVVCQTKIYTHTTYIEGRGWDR